MLFSVEQAFVGREEIRAPLKTPAWEARGPPPPCKQALTFEPCLGITIVSLYCFGLPRRKFSDNS